RVLRHGAFDQQQVAAVLGQRQGILNLVVQQQVALTKLKHVFAAGESELQLQGDTAVGDFDLQGMAKGAHQFAAADRVGQVVLAAVPAVEQHQAAAVLERVQ